MKEGTVRQIAAAKLREMDPDIYEECERMVIEPPLVDLRLLPAILDEIFSFYQPNPENSAFILGVVYYLYAPYKLHYKTIRADNGLRKIICNSFNWADTPIVNHYIGIMVVYYKNPRWAAKVKEMADYVIEIINENKAEILAAYNDVRDGE